MPQTCEVCREHTDVTSSEAVGVLSHKGRIFVGDLAKCYRSKFSKRKGGFLSCVCLFSSLGSLSPPWSLQEFWTFSPSPLSILCRAAWCWCFHQREVRAGFPVKIQVRDSHLCNRVYLTNIFKIWRLGPGCDLFLVIGSFLSPHKMTLHADAVDKNPVKGNRKIGSCSSNFLLKNTFGKFLLS